MRSLREGWVSVAAALLVAACSSSNNGSGGGGNGGGAGNLASSSTGGGAGGSGGTGGTGGSGGVGGSGGSGGAVCPSSSGIEHVVIIVQQNHTFDAYFGTYCTAVPGSNPTCTSGPSCCEAAPTMEPGGASPVVLDDAENAAYDPNHAQACEIGEIDNGMMDMFVTGQSCSNPDNFAIANDASVTTYRGYASSYAIADRYFQPIAGQSSSNDMYLAVAKEVFIDNAYEPDVTGSQCAFAVTQPPMTGQDTIRPSLLETAGKTVAWYGEGYADMKAAGSGCPSVPSRMRHQHRDVSMRLRPGRRALPLLQPARERPEVRARLRHAGDRHRGWQAARRLLREGLRLPLRAPRLRHEDLARAPPSSTRPCRPSWGAAMRTTPSSS